MAKSFLRRFLDWLLLPSEASRIAVLRVLKAGSLSGLDISKAADMDAGLLYRVLHELKEDGLIDSWWGNRDEFGLDRDRGGARRRYYGLTKLGQRYLQLHEAEECDRDA